MLVDDESDVRSRVLNNVNWEELGYKIVAEAENGKEAYELFERYEPDVLITDIKMPFMDGLELTEKILARYPYTKIIILTGFDEFEYAKKGILLQVEDYILKPISKQELTERLVRVREKIEEEKATRKNIDELRAYYESSYKLVRQKELENILEGNSSTDMKKWLDYYGLNLAGKLFSVLYISVDRDTADKDVEITNLKNIALLRFLDELKDALDLGEYLLYGEGVFLIQSDKSVDKSAFLKRLDKISNNLLQGASKYLDVGLTIGVGKVVTSLDEIYLSKETSLNAYDYKLLLGNNRAIFADDIEENTTAMLPIKNIDLRRLATFIRTGQMDNFEDCLKEIFVALIKDSADKYMSVEIQIFSVLDGIITELAIEDEAINDLKEGVLISISKQESHEEIKSGLVHLARKIVDINSLKRKNTTKDIVNKAKNIVASMLKSPELSLELIADEMHYSPNYLGTTFKKEVGTSLNAYILSLRIEEAKELLINSSLKSTDIAMSTGFSSSSYFAFSFKKAVGLSPREYRKSKRK